MSMRRGTVDDVQLLPSPGRRGPPPGRRARLSGVSAGVRRRRRAAKQVQRVIGGRHSAGVGLGGDRRLMSDVACCPIDPLHHRVAERHRAQLLGELLDQPPGAPSCRPEPPVVEVVFVVAAAEGAVVNI